ncbi:MAG: hypothetical protein Q7S65_02130 [Nanoarchaeota archaeon]|nr:hypothetical protein [Nanoarchaeota archaeon]
MKLQRLLMWTMLLLSGALSVSAAKTKFIPEALKNALDFVFVTLPKSAQAPGKLFNIYFRFMLFILVYAVLYYGTKKLFDKGNIAGVIAFVLALSSVSLIPAKVLQGIFGTYSVAIAVLAALAPALYGLYITKNIHNKLLKAAVWLLVALISFVVAGYLMKAGGASSGLYKSVGSWTMGGAVVALIVAVISLFHGGRDAYSSGKDAFGFGKSGNHGNGRSKHLTEEEEEIERKRKEEKEKEAQAKKLEEEMAKALNTAAQSVEHMAQIVKGIIDYLRKVATYGKAAPPEKVAEALKKAKKAMEDGLTQNEQIHLAGEKRIEDECKRLIASYTTVAADAKTVVKDEKKVAGDAAAVGAPAGAAEAATEAKQENVVKQEAKIEEKEVKILQKILKRREERENKRYVELIKHADEALDKAIAQVDLKADFGAALSLALSYLTDAYQLLTEQYKDLAEMEAILKKMSGQESAIQQQETVVNAERNKAGTAAAGTHTPTGP